MKRLLLALLLGWSTVATSAIISSYDFNYSLEDTLGTGPALQAMGGVLTSDHYEFSNNQGLIFSAGLSSVTEYFIEFGLRVTDSVAGYNKLLDFGALATDVGLYISSGSLVFYGIGQSAGAVNVNEPFVLGMARTAGSIKLYLDNLLISTVADSGNLAVSGSNELYFFVDDRHTGQSESFAGSLDFLRIHEDVSTFGAEPVFPSRLYADESVSPTAVPLPAGVWMMLSGLLGLAGIRLNRGKGLTAWCRVDRAITA